MENDFNEKLKTKIRNFDKTKDIELLSAEIANDLRDGGIPVRGGWVRSQFQPALLGVLERSLGEPSLAALHVCDLLQNDFQLPLFQKGLIPSDSPAYHWVFRNQQPKTSKVVGLYR